MAVQLFNSSVYDDHLKLDVCPHCRVQKPNLVKTWEGITYTDTNSPGRAWATFICKTCGGTTLAQRPALITFRNWEIMMAAPMTVYPEVGSVSDDVPERPRKYLTQAMNSLAQPDAAVMVAASAVDAMLKEKKLTKGSVKARIDQAVEQNLITDGMAEWANEVRIAANEQRHSDEEYEHASLDDAERLVKFALALGEFLFVLPARIAKGRSSSKEGLSSP